MQQVWDTAILALMLIAAVAARVRFEPRPRLPEQITSDVARAKDIGINTKLMEKL